MRFRLAIVVPLFALFVSAVRAADKPEDLILGKWQLTEPKTSSVIEFLKDGKLKVTGQDLTLEGKYAFIDDKTMELKVVLGGKEETSRYKFTLTKDELTTEDPKEGKKVLKRIKP